MFGVANCLCTCARGRPRTVTTDGLAYLITASPCLIPASTSHTARPIVSMEMAGSVNNCPHLGEVKILFVLFSLSKLKTKLTREARHTCTADFTLFVILRLHHQIG